MSKFFFLSILFNCWVSLAIAQVDSTTFCMPCDSLLKLNLPDVKMLTVETREKPVPHCRLNGIIGKEINFELVLPEDWNGRFSMSGNGGFAGSIQTGHPRLRLGFANVATDTGHKGEGNDGSWAYLHPERQVNFGHLAVHLTTVTAKAIVEQYYCQAPAYSYFVGCSRGGGQAMMEAQRYPEEFDGIIAGAPAFDWTHLAAEFVQNTQAIFPNPSTNQQPIITDANLALLQEAVLTQCDTKDGINDGILNDPRDCPFDFEQLPLCPEGTASKDCFTSKQLESIKKVYEGVSVDQQPFYAGFPLGCESEPRGWKSWITGTTNNPENPYEGSLQRALGVDVFRYFIFHDPEWSHTKYDFTGYEDKVQFTAATLDASSTDYSQFIESGGKMIMYHGWNDPCLSALSTVQHYEKAMANNPRLDDHIRLFMMPGVLHCNGGPGPSHTDWLKAIMDWVENDQAPDQMILTKRKKGKTVLERPTFPYPAKAVYDGKGDPSKASSFYKSND
ncbi:MAG: tannase/feruloyl esterase family alpha/beta hydrolase [Bacteroidota bacterium]